MELYKIFAIINRAIKVLHCVIIIMIIIIIIIIIINIIFIIIIIILCFGSWFTFFKLAL